MKTSHARRHNRKLSFVGRLLGRRSWIVAILTSLTLVGVLGGVASAEGLFNGNSPPPNWTAGQKSLFYSKQHQATIRGLANPASLGNRKPLPQFGRGGEPSQCPGEAKTENSQFGSPYSSPAGVRDLLLLSQGSVGEDTGTVYELWSGDTTTEQDVDNNVGVIVLEVWNPCISADNAEPSLYLAPAGEDHLRMTGIQGEDLVKLTFGDGADGSFDLLTHKFSD